ncbi:DUF2946 domain-containing protein [Burkholderia sp. WAC0059]|uniref:DUF2946 domain-containing protein n=1 Tax=Burkholderia sp. WAC0059 TaxID=2066022 RepID=UPI0015E15985|nr:DUF2946 domain-containing protein [Burkholderia sp. WAC0059]
MSRIRLQKLGSLLGLLAILMSTLAPTISQTLASRDRLQQALATYCTAVPESGGMMMAMPGDGDKSSPAHASNWQACAYCGLLAHMPVMPGMVIPFAAAQAVAHASVALAHDEVRALFSHTAAKPRAPPVFS